MLSLSAQKVIVSGKVTDKSSRKGLPGATLFVKGQQIGTSSDSLGRFNLKIPKNESVILLTSFIGYDTSSVTLSPTSLDSIFLDIKLDFKSSELSEFVFRDRKLSTASLNKIDPKTVDQVAVPNPSIEKTLTFQGLGVFSNNELSSQYNVRGGSFDENLIYVNDIEIYRPFLARSGQQEGLSFINPSLVESVSFSSGGFQAKYGDKMSSVLDVKYKKPTKKLGGSVEASLLGIQAHIAHSSDNNRFTQIHGIRYRSNQYVLNSLDTEGDYKPRFTDYQAFFTYDVLENLELGLLLAYSKNKYEFIPRNRQTEFGGIQQAIRFTVFYDGLELTEFETGTAALSATWYPKPNIKLKLIASNYSTAEQENFDVNGAYRLDELNRDLGSDDFGQVAFSRGVGQFINHGRNYLFAQVGSLQHKGTYFGKKATLSWGAKLKNEVIEDELNEWEMIDSAGFSIPQKPSDQILLNNVTRNRNNISSNRATAYIQYTRNFQLDSNEFYLSFGTRLHYWSFNEELVGGPRAQLTFVPKKNRNLSFKAALGYYYQPPFYREMRGFDGTVNKEIKSQLAIHYVLGADYIFEMWKRPFKFTSEAYYKDLRNLIPYEIDNIKLRYHATNNSNGFAYGIDFKINGEFVKGVESWVSMSFLNTEENLTNDVFYEYRDVNGEKTNRNNPFRPVADTQIIYPGFIPRPSDQTFNFAVFFQDYLPGNKTLKMNITMMFGTGLPYGPPSRDRFRDVLRMPSYRRVDLGMSKELLRADYKERKASGKKGPFKHLESIWLNLEVFNLLGVNNTISYQWARDIEGNQWPIPNYLTNRQLNLKLQVNF